jgi:23S rRNA (adenine2503-C2)-methyltransferase
MKLIRSKQFANGIVYALETDDGYPIETTDTFLPFYTRDCINQNTNKLTSEDLGNRCERWMVGVSVMSGCPVRCKFCATGSLPKIRNLSAEEIRYQLHYILSNNRDSHPLNSKEFKINYTRMGEPFLNIENVKEAVDSISDIYPNTHHYISTIGVRGSDFSFIKGNVSLQFSIHALDDKKRDWLIPFKNKMSLKEISEVRTQSNLKTTLNLTLVDESDFNINILKDLFDPNYFFIKLSPINKNEISESNQLGGGVITSQNLV